MAKNSELAGSDVEVVGKGSERAVDEESKLKSTIFEVGEVFLLVENFVYHEGEGVETAEEVTPDYFDKGVGGY